MKSFVRFHVFPLMTGIGVAGILVWLIVCAIKFRDKEFVVTGKQTNLSGAIGNYEQGEKTEIDFMASLKAEKTITLFGSSELGSLSYSPYYYLTDSAGVPVLAFGHAHHQCFSMFCELLAAQPYLKKAKVCILLSPGWFVTEGTNTEAFLEFVPLNFLRSIAHNTAIPDRFKQTVARYVASHYAEIDGSDITLTYFRNKAFSEKLAASTLAMVPRVRYEFSLSEQSFTYKGLPRSFEERSKNLQKEFVSTIRTNRFYIEDAYYQTYLNTKEKPYKPSVFTGKELGQTQEMNDFMLLVELLKYYDCDASFVLQPLNPFYYQNLSGFHEKIEQIETVLRKNNFPLLNLFVERKEDFEPAVLRDIMHLGNYGWMKINRFLITTYYDTTH